MSDQATPNTVESTEPKPIDPLLLDKLAYLRQLVGIDNLLLGGLFPGQASKAILESQAFLKSIHAIVMAECEQHPDFARVQAAQKAPGQS